MERIMHGGLTFVALAVLVSACSRQDAPLSRSAASVSGARAVVLKVDGMQRGAGGKT